MSSINFIKIKDICNKVSVGYVGSTTKYFSTKEKGIPFLRSKNIRLGRIDMNDLAYVTKDFHNKNKKSQLKKGDIVIVRVGQNRGDVCKISDEFEEMNVANCVFLRPPKEYSDYLEILLRSPFGQKLLLSISTGSAQEVLNTGAIAELKVPVPKIEMIEYVASLINSFDNKINLLKQQNTTLETIAQTIFKEWFGKYQIGDELPEGWTLGTIGDLTKIKRGGSPRPIKDYISDSGYRWLKISDATATDSPYIFEIKEHIKVEGLKKTTLKKAGDLVLSNSATPGMPKFLAVDSCVHDGWMHFPSSKVSNEYLYLLFLHIKPILVQQGSGSVFVNLKTDILRFFETVIPSNKAFKDFDKLIKPIFEKILSNAKQIQSLTLTRDTLLPKLMSGEIRVKL
ncbi:restriction endonuclease subunit S [Arenibacter algicola]|uniref:restriction endonuclease subunit S n=1 Tax=Arenibacter algicola TaxID=616991 RepID=UPI001C07076C|nr:restriction endonuclease subunit S [Arenibacter algicola]MBU2905121.1 restriction endonuclease subunit S [Arenibacter algicola]